MPAFDMETTEQKLAAQSNLANGKREDLNAAPANALTSVFSVLRWHLYTIFLFTASDFKTIVIPTTVCGTFNALSGSISSTGPQSPAYAVRTRAPLVIFWAWINVLSFDIANSPRLHDKNTDRSNLDFETPCQKKRGRRRGDMEDLEPLDINVVVAAFHHKPRCHFTKYRIRKSPTFRRDVDRQVQKRGKC
ncbi:hypothetical protein MMC29_001846 [Sticta canariensis]|nr:hypothetical protein [Sticta canariensis]